MNIINNCPVDEIAKKEIEKCEKFVEEVLSNYDIKCEIVIEECGDHWFKLNNENDVVKILKEDKVHSYDKDMIYLTKQFWFKIRNDKFVLCS